MHRTRAILLSLILSLVGNGLRPNAAIATSSTTLEATYTSVSEGWAKVERWYDSSPGFFTAQYPPDGRLDQTGQRKTHFNGVARPDAGRYLLSYAPGWNTNPKPTPVLLVAGSYETADFAWANPASSPIGCGSITCPTTGMMQSLSSAGYKVFAITFPHSVGNNYNHAEQIRDAIVNIKVATGALQVDVVAWSQGTLAARMYVSGVRQSWGSAYFNDVRKMILIGGPNNGWDYTFRHGTYPAIASYTECGGSKIGGTAAVWQSCFGTWYFHPELSPYVTTSGDFFPGIRQMLKRWDGIYPLNPANPDAYTTYNGGLGAYGYSLGIDYAIGQGSLTNTIGTSPVPTAVSTYLLCGNTPNIPYWNNELDGPSDGTILVASCTNTGGIGTLAGTATVPVNHLQLTWASQAVNQVKSWLG